MRLRVIARWRLRSISGDSGAPCLSRRVGPVESMSRVLVRCFLAAAFAMIAAAGCAFNGSSRTPMFVLSTPEHLQDWERLRSALEAQHIKTKGGISDLGGCEFCVPSPNAAQARPLVEGIIRNERLTVRVTKEASPQVYQVYQNGQRIREESYVIR